MTKTNKLIYYEKNLSVLSVFTAVFDETMKKAMLYNNLVI